jgi:sulfopyruvate decarboxylase TPP-binding subunit
LNAITSLVLPYQMPMLVVVSLRGDAGEWNAAQVPMGRALRAIFDALAMAHVTIDTAESADEVVRRAGETAFGTRQVHVCLLPRRMTAPHPATLRGEEPGRRHA